MREKRNGKEVEMIVSFALTLIDGLKSRAYVFATDSTNHFTSNIDPVLTNFEIDL